MHGVRRGIYSWAGSSVRSSSALFFIVIKLIRTEKAFFGIIDLLAILPYYMELILGLDTVSARVAIRRRASGLHTFECVVGAVSVLDSSYLSITPSLPSISDQQHYRPVRLNVSCARPTRLTHSLFLKDNRSHVSISQTLSACPIGAWLLPSYVSSYIQHHFVSILGRVNRAHLNQLLSSDILPKEARGTQY